MSAAVLASGKGHRDENFPVASVLIAPAHRAPVLAFYRFARVADDVSDHPTASADEKLHRLGSLRATLLGEDDAEPEARVLREVIAARGLDRRHPLDLLEAFGRDVTKRRYRDWDDLIDYCRVSAMPVGRFVLDVHGEDRALWPANDALCAALQIVNHLQDCREDFRKLDRVYLPQDILAEHGARTEELGEKRASPRLHAALRDVVARTRDLLDESRAFSAGIADRRLGVEVAVIQALAESLAARLERRDPLSQRVHHGKAEMLAIAARAAVRRLVRR